MPRLLSEENKRNRVIDSEAILVLFRGNPDEFRRRYIIRRNMDALLHYYTPETKEQSKKWAFEGERAPKMAKTMKSAGKVMVTVFWDAHGIIYTNYLEKGQMIAGEYYASLLHQLSEEITKKRPHFKKKMILFRQDNAQVHTCAVSMAKFMELKFELLQHLLYSPELDPNDFFLFPNLKNGSADNGSRRTRRSPPKQMPSLRTFQNPTIERDPRMFRSGVESSLSFSLQSRAN